MVITFDRIGKIYMYNTIYEKDLFCLSFYNDKYCDGTEKETSTISLFQCLGTVLEDGYWQSGGYLKESNRWERDPESMSHNW